MSTETSTTEIYTALSVGSVRCVYATGAVLAAAEPLVSHDDFKTRVLGGGWTLAHKGRLSTHMLERRAVFLPRTSVAVGVSSCL